MKFYSREKEQYCYTYIHKAQGKVIDLLLTGDYEMEDRARRFLKSIQVSGPKDGYLTYKQMRWLGGLSKAYLQNGQYLGWNWWNGWLNIVKRITPEKLPAYKEAYSAGDFDRAMSLLD